jgi:hypothetical protein
MAEHLSALALDELALGEGTREAHDHLSGCATCLEKLRLLQAPDPRRGSEPYERAYRLAARAKPPPPRFALRRWAGGAGLAAAAALAFFVLRPPTPSPDRLKGAPALLVLNASEVPIRKALAGETVSIQLAGVTAPWVALVSVDGSGEVALVWPTDGQSAALPPGGRIPVALEVTPGSSELFALYSSESFSANEVRSRIGGLAQRDPRVPDPVLEQTLPKGVRWVRTQVEVEGRR